MISYWQRSREIIQSIVEKGKQSVYKLSEQTGIPKSSVYRHLKGILKRKRCPESEFWETALGRQFLSRLVIAVLYDFCIKGGIGAERASDFLKRMGIDSHVGVSPTALRGKLKEIEELLVEYQGIQEKEQCKNNKTQEIIAAGDETFFNGMILLVLMDLSSGYLLLEEEADDRTYETWNQKAQARLNEIGLRVRHFVSDRAKALIKLGVDGFGCEKVGSDLFHGQYEISKWLGAQLHRKLSQTKNKIEDLKKSISSLRQRNKDEDLIKAEEKTLIEQEACLQCHQENHDDYHTELQNISLSVHPFNESNGEAQTTEDVVKRLQACADEFTEIAASVSISNSRDALGKFTRQIEDIASNVGVWWVWVKENLTQYDLNQTTQEWVTSLLLPVFYWHRQMERTKNPVMKASYKKAWEKALNAWRAHHLLHNLSDEEIEHWKAWAIWMVEKFQRTSSAVEGRNGWLSQMYCNGRSLKTLRLKAMTVIHNFDLRRASGTTSAERLFDKKFPDLFEWTLERVGALPLARERRKDHDYNRLNLQNCPALSG